MININSALYEQACSLLTELRIPFRSAEAPACASVWSTLSLWNEDAIEEVLREHFGDSIILAVKVHHA